MEKEEIIPAIVNLIQVKFKDEPSGHDWWHIYRVWKTSLKIAEKEQANRFVIELAALLHDIADWKFHEGDEKAGGKEARKILKRFNIDEALVDHVVEIVDSVSYKGAGVETKMRTIEGQIVQDADRLDAIGAIGIARTFAYGGSKNRCMYNPEVSPELHENFDAYKASKSHTINHFHEKLLLLKDRMNTITGKRMAEERHCYMETFLAQFHKEWNVE